MLTQFQMLLKEAGVSPSSYGDQLAELVIMDSMNQLEGASSVQGRPYSLDRIAKAVKNPRTHAQLIKLIRGKVADARPHVLYSTVLMTAAAGTYPDETGRLFGYKRGTTQQLGYGTDALGEYETNMEDDGKMPRGQKFIANAVRFSIEDSGDADAAELIGPQLRAIVNSVFKVKFGEEKEFYLGRIGQYLSNQLRGDLFQAVASDVRHVQLAAPATANPYALPGGMVIPFNPEESFHVPLAIDGEACGAALGTTEINIRCEFSGVLLKSVG